MTFLEQAQINTTDVKSEPGKELAFSLPEIFGFGRSQPAAPSEQITPPEQSMSYDQRLQIAEQEVQLFGRNYLDTISSLMKNNRVVGIGETHIADDQMRLHGPQIIAALKESGVTHLAVEVQASQQALFDEFNKTGYLDVSKLTNMLQFAHLNMAPILNSILMLLK